MIGKKHPHDSAELHVTGEANYIDDLKLPANTLHIAVGLSTIAHGKIISLDLTDVIKAKGVIDVITASDIPGKVDIGPVFPGDLLLTDSNIEFHGQAIFAVAASDYLSAQRAIKQVKINYKEEKSLLELQEAIDQQVYVRPPHGMSCGNAKKAIESAPHTIRGSLNIGGQDHLYLEGQVSVAIPEEDNCFTIYSSNQNPTETQR